MKKIIAVFIFCFFPGIIFCQEPVYEWGQPLTDETPQAEITGIIYSDSSGFYVLRDNESVSNHLVFLEKYSPEYKMLYSLEVIPLGSQGVMGNSMLYRTILTGKNKFLVFSQGWNKETGKGNYTVKTITPDGKIDDEGKELESLTAEKQANAGYHHPALSPDKSKLLILTDMPYEKDGKEKIRLRVFDAQTFTQLWTKDITLNFESKKGVNNEGIVDNDGNVYVFKKFEEKGDYTYLLYTCDAVKKEWKENTLDLKGNLVSDYTFLFNNKGNAVLTGFYYTKFDTEWKGIYYFRFNKTSLNFDVNVVEPFGVKFLQNFMNENAASKEDAALKNFKLRDVLSMSADGNILIIAEKELTSQKMLPVVAGQTTAKYEYTITSEEIVAWCIKEDGSELWSTVIPKSQSTTTQDISERWDSFVYGLIGDRLYILWNNINLTPVGIIVNPEKWIAQDGKSYTYKTAFDAGYWDKTGTNVSRTTNHATFIYIVEANGTLTYADTKYGLTLFNLHKDCPFSMSLKPDIFYTVDDGIILMGEMQSISKKYKFGIIKL